MSSLSAMQKMHYIVDRSGNFYRINGNDQLVAASGREDAGVFGFLEANQRIGGGKKAQFYSAVPVDEYEGTDEAKAALPTEQKKSANTAPRMEEAYKPDPERSDAAICESESKMSLPYDMKCIDWKEYLTHFCYIAANVHNYIDELNQELSDLDMQTCDMVHYIELYDQNEEDSIRLIALLKECREQRRDVKDEMNRVEWFQRAIGSSSNIAKARDGIKQMDKLKTRVYHPRKLKALFKDCPEKTVRSSKLIRAFTSDTCLDIEKEFTEEPDMDYITEEGEYMEYTKQTTIFDGAENNWREFAKQQADFFANAEQYMYNLQADLEELDLELEQTLREIEDANYNVAQGYKVFKHLKDLRNAKKEKQKELDCLYILTERFDCGAMAEVMDECVCDIESVLAEPEQAIQETDEVRELEQAMAG